MRRKGQFEFSETNGPDCSLTLEGQHWVSCSFSSCVNTVQLAVVSRHLNGSAAAFRTQGHLLSRDGAGAAPALVATCFPSQGGADLEPPAWVGKISFMLLGLIRLSL